MGRDAFEGDMCQPGKVCGCAGKITVIFSNTAGQQHYEVHGCGISIINVEARSYYKMPKIQVHSEALHVT